MEGDSAKQRKMASIITYLTILAVGFEGFALEVGYWVVEVEVAVANSRLMLEATKEGLQ